MWPVERPTVKRYFDSPTEHRFIRTTLENDAFYLYSRLVVQPPEWCCSLYNYLQDYSYCICPTRMVLLSIQLSAGLQLLYLPHQIGAAPYKTICRTTATVSAPPDWCCSLYNYLQYYSYCTCPTTQVLLSIQLSAILQLLYLPHQTCAALYTTLCNTTATVTAPPEW